MTRNTSHKARLYAELLAISDGSVFIQDRHVFLFALLSCLVLPFVNLSKLQRRVQMRAACGRYWLISGLNQGVEVAQKGQEKRVPLCQTSHLDQTERKRDLLNHSNCLCLAHL